MAKSRVFSVLVAIAAIIVAAATLSLTGANVTRPSDDFAIRHPDGMPRGAAFYAGSDYFLRHPEAARLDVGGAKGHSFEVTFTKWITSPPNMIGVVGGDVGTGTFAGEIKSMTDNADKSFTTVVAVYHINGSEHSFSADIQAVQNNGAGTGVITGEITEGWLKGRALSGKYTVLAVCNMVTEPNANGTLCFQGTLSIPAAP